MGSIQLKNWRTRSGTSNKFSTIKRKVKEKKIIEKDKEKTRVKWKKMMDKLDSEFLDELASIKFASKMIEDEAENEKKM